MNRPIAAALTILVLASASAAVAQSKKVYRCEEGGRVVYGDAPCKAAVEVKADDKRSDAERAAAREAVQRERKLVQQQKSEREAAEASAAGQGYGHVPHTAAQKAAVENVPSKPAAKPRPKKKIVVAQP
jgi:Domain of unknown function (DUF4124)